MTIPNAKLRALSDHMVANLIDYFRNPQNHGCYVYAAKIASNQVERLSPFSAERVEAAFISFSRKLKDGITPASLRTFSENCLGYAYKQRLLGAIDQEKPTPSVKSPSGMKKTAVHAISRAIEQGFSHHSAVNKAAHELFKERSEQTKQSKLASLTKAHPLGETLRLLNASNRTLPKEDIRSHFLGLKKMENPTRKGEGVLYSMLAKAQCFGAANLLRLLGDELFYIVRPVGFLDREGTTIVVEVMNESQMYALTYKKMVILKALQKDPAFSSAKNIRFKVPGSPQAYLHNFQPFP
jgi:hypothetical protein